MTQEETLTYNKMCAEFLGMYDYSKDNEYFEKGLYFCYSEKDKNPGCGYYTTIYNGISVFVSDWNWIMEVVEAIETLYDSNVYFKVAWDNVTIGIATQYELAHDTGFEGVEIHREVSKKAAVVEGINRFLIWYNENK